MKPLIYFYVNNNKKIMKYIVTVIRTDYSNKFNKIITQKYYFIGMLFGFPNFSYNKKEARIFDTKKAANSIASLRKNYIVEKYK